MPKSWSKAIQEAFARPAQKYWAGSDPLTDFPGGVFTGNNWNDARLNLLRELVERVEPGGREEIDWDDGVAVIFHCWHEDQHYVFIVVNHEDESRTLYHIEWYKRRGKTECATKDGRPITLDELRHLCEQLARGFGLV